jgi:hypothetical protein
MKPFTGAKVLFFAATLGNLVAAKPVVGFITCVWSDTCVNLRVDSGVTHTSVYFLSGDYAGACPTGYYCTLTEDQEPERPTVEPVDATGALGQAVLDKIKAELQDSKLEGMAGAGAACGDTNQQKGLSDITVGQTIRGDFDKSIQAVNRACDVLGTTRTTAMDRDRTELQTLRDEVTSLRTTVANLSAQNYSLEKVLALASAAGNEDSWRVPDAQSEDTSSKTVTLATLEVMIDKIRCLRSGRDEFVTARAQALLLGEGIEFALNEVNDELASLEGDLTALGIVA